MSLAPQAVVNDIVSECNGTPLGSAGPWTLFNVAGITSGQIYDKITEANAALQGWTGQGGSTSPNALLKEQTKRFEVSYASARLAADLIGISITDGFNYNIGGLAVQRQTAQFATFKQFIDDHLLVAKEYYKMLMQWFYVFNSDFPTGYNEYGAPITYWSTSRGPLA